MGIVHFRLRVLMMKLRKRLGIKGEAEDPQLGRGSQGQVGNSSACKGQVEVNILLELVKIKIS